MQTEYQAAGITAFGNPPTLELIKMDARRLKPVEVRVKTLYSGVSFVDLLLVRGKYQILPSLPYVPGTEFSGIVSEVGPSVVGFDVGDVVCGISLGGGAWAEQIVGDASDLYAAPASLSHAEAAAFPASYETAYHAWTQRGSVSPGETALVLGASGMLGAAAVEVGTALGLRVLKLGASSAADPVGQPNNSDVVYPELELRAQLEAQNAYPLDLVFDSIGGAYAQTCFRQLGWGGRYLVLGFAGGEIGNLPMNLPLLKGAGLIGVNFREFLQKEPLASAANRSALGELMQKSTMRPRLGQIFQLAEITQAIDAAANRNAKGRVLLSFDDSSAGCIGMHT